MHFNMLYTAVVEVKKKIIYIYMVATEHNEHNKFA